jgi:hypothetical protein
LGFVATAPARAGAGLAVDYLMRMSPEELLALYRTGTAVVPRAGFVRGQALVRPGSAGAPLLSRGARVVWQGKEFRPDGTAVNHFLGVPSIAGRLGLGPSWVDGLPTLVLDYRGTSRVYRRYRDEIRQVAPCLLLGIMYDAEACPPRIVRYFALCP